MSLLKLRQIEKFIIAKKHKKSLKSSSPLRYNHNMSFQAYLDNIETKTGKTPSEFIELAKTKGFEKVTKSSEIVAWLKNDYKLGYGHAMALVYVIKNGAKIGDKHVNSGGSHNDDSNQLRLDGIDNR